MRKYILALLAAVVLVAGAFAINRSGTDPPSAPYRELPRIPHDFRLR
jgi:hypothetical protein